MTLDEFCIKKSKFMKQWIISEKSFSLESCHKNIHECTWKIWFHVQNWFTHTFLEHASYSTRNTVKKAHKAQSLTAAERPIWETAPEPLQTNLPWWGDLAVTDSLPAHLQPVFFTDAPWWVAISGYFSNDFHSASWVQFRACSLEHSAGWTNQRR